MFKRIVVGILSAVFAAVALCGCGLFTYDSELDLRREVARVKSYTISNSVVVKDTDENGEEIERIETVNYSTSPSVIYKYDLLEYVNSNASNLSSSFGSDYERLYKYAVSMLISTKLVTNEVDALIDCGKIEWGVEQQNKIKKNIYSVIDNTLVSLKNNILSERDLPQIDVSTESAASSSTTYPVKPEPAEEADPLDPFEKEEEEPWAPDLVMYPGLSGDSDERSLGREAMRRLLALLKNRVADDFRMSSDERKAIDNEIKAIDRIINTKGIEYVYPLLGTYPLVTVNGEGEEVPTEFGHIMYYVSGKSIERSQKITSLQAYLTDGTVVYPDEVYTSFTSTLNEQKKQYSTNVADFDSAMSSDSSQILYYPNDNYFYVKHILLPFSDEQKDALTAFKNRPDIKNLQKDEKEKRVNEYRDLLVGSIVCYPHVDGEDDKSHPLSVGDVMDHIGAVMRGLESDPTAASEAFDDLTYLYNTDPGAFGNSQGYVVKYRLGEGESETYMQEFADAARYMRENLKVGQVYYEPVVTDYGVHIMYFASTTKVGEVNINDYTSSARDKTYYDVLAESVRTKREEAAYTGWENEILSYNYNKYSVTYTENFSNLWEK